MFMTLPLKHSAILRSTEILMLPPTWGKPGMLIMGIITLEENSRPHVAHTVPKMLLSKVLVGAGASSKQPRHLTVCLPCPQAPLRRH